MPRIIRLTILLYFLLTFPFKTLVLAAPMAPRPVVNHQTRQCAIITPGDECGGVILPAGWEYLDKSAGVECPAGYATVELKVEWTHFKAAHCCTKGHSGTSGDCQDVVIQHSKQRCAFVEDIQACVALPQGWETWGKNCPSDFKWVDQVDCKDSSTAASTALESTPSSTPSLGDSSGSGGEKTTPGPTDVPNPLLPCLSSAMPLTILIGAGVFSFRKRYET